jgi:hypothetical protein
MTDPAFAPKPSPHALNDQVLPYGLDGVPYVALPNYLWVGNPPVYEIDREQRNYARGAEAWVSEQTSRLTQQSTVAEKLVICLRYFPGRYLPKADLLRGLGKPSNYPFSLAMKDPKVAREVYARGWRYALGGKGRPSYFVSSPLTAERHLKLKES